MSEDLEQKSEGINFQHYLGLVRRRIWFFIVPLFVGWAVVWGASWGMKSTYRSGTLILIEAPTISPSIVAPTILGNSGNRVQNLTQTIMSRTRLLHIIEDQHLYKEAKDAAPDDVVERMRKDIEIELVYAADRETVTAFNVYYSSSDPNTAQRVTSELTSLFISENIENRRTQGKGTTDFLEGRLEEAKASLTAQEDQIRTYKEQHNGDLPDNLAGNLQILSGLQAQRGNEEDALNRAKQQSIYLETLLNQYKMQRSTKTGDKTNVGLPALDDELDRLKTQLADLSSHYTDKHPDVKKVKEQIARTEKMRAQVAADLQAKAANPVPDAPSPDNDIKEVGPMLEMQTQLKMNKIEIGNREKAVQDLNSQISEYQGRLNRQPVREQQLTELTRNYEQSRALYESLLKKKDDSELAAKLEDSQNGEHFRILDPPGLPMKPYSPNRLKLSGIGLAVGLLLGAVFVAGAEILDDRLYNEKELKEMLPATVITEIPAMITLQEENRDRRSVWIERVAAVLVFASILAGTAVSFLAG